MTTVVDASVVVDWVAPDVNMDAPAVALLHRLAQHEEPLAAPRLLLHEVANALLMGIRRGRWNGSEADTAHLHLQRLSIRVLDVDDDSARAFELARRHDEHPVYDMVYLALAERISATLVTADRRLLDRASHLAYVQAVVAAAQGLLPRRQPLRGGPAAARGRSVGRRPVAAGATDRPGHRQ